MLPGALRPCPSASVSPRGCSVEYSTFTPLIPSFLQRVRTVRARGQVSVFSIRVTRNAVGSSLLPVPMEQMIGTFRARVRRISSILALTVSMASTT